MIVINTVDGHFTGVLENVYKVLERYDMSRAADLMKLTLDNGSTTYIRRDAIVSIVVPAKESKSD